MRYLDVLCVLKANVEYLCSCVEPHLLRKMSSSRENVVSILNNDDNPASVVPSTFKIPRRDDSSQPPPPPSPPPSPQEKQQQNSHLSPHCDEQIELSRQDEHDRSIRGTHHDYQRYSDPPLVSPMIVWHRFDSASPVTATSISTSTSISYSYELTTRGNYVAPPYAYTGHGYLIPAPTLEPSINVLPRPAYPAGPHPHAPQSSLPQLKDNATISRTNRKNKYPCPFAASYQCTATFTTSGHAARHGRKHTGEKSVLCPICNKAFTRKDNMKQHIRIHGAVSEPEGTKRSKISPDNEKNVNNDSLNS